MDYGETLVKLPVGGSVVLPLNF